MINLLASEKAFNICSKAVPQVGRSDHFAAKSLLHLESKVDNIRVKDGDLV